MADLIIPSGGESVTQVTLLRWAKKEGEYVRRDEVVAELETDKANVDLPATASGVLHTKNKPGDVIKVGQVIGQIDESAPAPAGKAPATSAAPAAKPAQTQTAPASQPAPSQPKSAPAEADDLSPAVRKMVVESGVNPRSIPGTGPGGRLLKEDVQRYLEERSAEGNGNGSAPAAAPPAPPIQARTETPATRPPGPDFSKPTGQAPLNFNADGVARVPMSKIRRRIASTLVQAQQTAAILTTFNEVDLTAISEIRGKYKEKFEKSYGVGLGFMSFFARATVLALREFPQVNAFIEGEEILYHNYVNLGVAVSTERGLTVPVLRNVENMSFAKIESEIKRLANSSREGKLGIQELSGGTFTITNGGVYGSLLSTPILLPPQSAILGMHAIQKRPMAIGDKIEIRPMMYVALSYDHRLIDGRDSVSFLVRIKDYLEDPARLMLEI